MKVLNFSSPKPEATVSRLRGFHVAVILALAIAGASAQSVSSFTPTNGIPGTPVTVNGASLGVVTNVTFNGASCIFQTLSASKIIATVPLGATSGKIAVNGFASSPSFIVAPRIDAITPYKVRTNMAGALINGANLTNATSVKLNGTNLTFTVLSASQIQFTVPANAVTGPLTITTPGGSVTTNNLVVTSLPEISGFSPAAAKIGSALTITGINLTNITSVKINGTTVSPVTNSGVGGQQLKVSIPVGSTSGAITVTTPAGTATSTNRLLTGSTPVIESFGSTLTTPGATLTMKGFNFQAASPLLVTFSNASAVTATVASDSNLSVVVPSAAVTGPVIIKAGASLISTNTNGITVVHGPYITNFQSAGATRGSYVFFNGFNFSGPSFALYFNGVQSTDVTINSSNLVRARVPNTATSGFITVQNSNGTNTTTNTTFIVQSIGPGVLSFSPTNGHAGDTVQITGYNFFGGGQVSVTFSNASAITLSPPSDTSLTVTVPAAAVTGPIRVSHSQGSFTTTNLFYVWPKITGLSSTNAIPGTLITITGANFTGATNVLFNGVMSPSFTVNNSSNITATVPDAEVSGFVDVVTPAGIVGATNSFVVMPQLTVVLLPNGDVQLAWQSWATSFVLQSTTDLSLPLSWAADPGSPVIVGSEFQLIQTPAEPYRFYRLRRP